MLQQLASALVIPGLPDWVGLVVLVVLALVALAYLLMPFSVFGLKGRLEAIEAQLDEIQTEIRSLTARMPEPGRRRAPVEDDWAEPPKAARPPIEAPRLHPPIPPPAAWPDDNSRSRRSEPRLDWPRSPR
ncbi:hypothetical protein ACLF3G_12390 [Falsiroseomonas sp. HC035]|uniref:hypothetical protein n=1 Tax=Falsiroseomonas sp. HC035 TaxID=3390999 RepID=UPI003D314BA5